MTLSKHLPSFLLTGDGPVGKGKEMEFIFSHSLDHTLFVIPGIDLPVTRFGSMVVISALVLIALVLPLDRKSLVGKGFARNALEALLLFIRDELVRPAMGHHGDRFVPFFCTLFLFILTMNLIGLIPLPFVGGTATSSFWVTGTLAAIILIVGLASGLALHGVGGTMRAFVPGGLPKVLVPLLFVLELFGHLIKHFVLMVRLFANMIAGHLILGAFLGLIFIAEAYVAYAIVPSLLLALFISAMELLVGFIQAYVFTLLSVLFVGSLVHPEH